MEPSRTSSISASTRECGETMDAVVHGVEWTIKELFVYPNEYIYWSIQIVMYPYMTGLVAGAFVLSSLYHVFGQKDLKEIAQFSLVFSLALLPVAALPLLLHLQQPTRAMEPLLTPHFTSAIAAFGIVFTTYGLIVVSEIWFVYRKYFVEQVHELKGKPGFFNMVRLNVYRALTLGSFDISEEAQRVDEKAAKILAGVGIPVACFLHGYAGFIFGSVKANALMSLLRADEAKKIKGVEKVKETFLAAVSKMAGHMDANPYNIATKRFGWGSNGGIAATGGLMIEAFLVTKDRKYLMKASRVADYLLGRNATGYCFVTGFGTKSTRHPHHRPSSADGIDDPVPGLTVFGPTADESTGGILGAALAAYESGKRFYTTRRGQLNFACTSCHVQLAGNLLRAERLSASLGHVTHWPVYRFKWEDVGSLHKRFQECNSQVGAEPFDEQSEPYRNLGYFLAYLSNGLELNGPATRK